MHLIKIIALIFIGVISASLASEEKERIYDKAMSLRIAYDPKGSGAITVTLTNISDSKLKLMLNTAEVEGEYSIGGSKDKKDSFYDRDYLRKLLTSQWFSGACDLEPKKSVIWTVKLDELVYFGVDEKPVTHASLEGKTFSLKLHRLAVFPAGKSNIYLNVKSNTIRIPTDRTR